MTKDEVKELEKFDKEHGKLEYKGPLIFIKTIDLRGMVFI